MAHTVILLLVVVSCCAVTQACDRQAKPRCTSKCKWTSWSAWGSCSANCGSEGRKLSTRQKLQLGTCEASDCYNTESRTKACSTPCVNGRNVSGSCECDDGFTGECCDGAEPNDQDESCADKGGACVQYWQGCDGGDYVMGSCGNSDQYRCCVPADPSTQQKQCIDRGGECIGYYQSCDGDIEYGLCGTNSYDDCCVPADPNREKPCKDKGGACLDYSQSCNGGDFEYGLCGANSNYDCCIPADPNREKPCKDKGGACLDYPQSCNEGEFEDGLCGANSNYDCCIPVDPSTRRKPCTDRGGECIGYSKSCNGGDIEYGLCGSNSYEDCCIPGEPQLATVGPVETQCIAKGGYCAPEWSACSGGDFVYQICGTNSVYGCCIPGEAVTKAAPTWDKKCKAQNGECLFGWKTDCGSDILYDLCGSGGHQCCIDLTKTAGVAKAAGEECRTRGGHCLYRYQQWKCAGESWSDWCDGTDNQQCCIPNSVMGDFQCVHEGGQCLMPDSCDGGEYRAGLCAGEANRKCCIPGLEPLAKSFPDGQCSDVTTVSRADWKAVSANSSSVMTLPVKKVIIHHTNYPTCSTEASCEGQMRHIQLDDKNNNNCTDIAYSYLVGGDGRAYVGRGWAVKATDGGDSISIAAMGPFSLEEPSMKLVNAIANLLDCAVEQGVLEADFEILAHRQVACTDCPGRYMVDVIKTSARYNKDTSFAGCSP